MSGTLIADGRERVPHRHARVPDRHPSRTSPDGLVASAIRACGQLYVAMGFARWWRSRFVGVCM